MGFVDKEAALAALPAGDHDLKAFWIRKLPPLIEHQVIVEMWPGGTVDLTFWDFDGEVLKKGEPTEAQKAEKCSLALTLYRSLVKDAGAIMSSISEWDNKYAGVPNQDELAELMANAFRKDPTRAFKLILENYGIFWMIVLDKKALAKPLQAYRKKLEKHFRVAEETPGWLILQTPMKGPLFMYF